MCAPKDKLKKEQVGGVVYHIACAGSEAGDCNRTYVGESERILKTRFAEHTGRSSVNKSEVATHVFRDNPDHNIDLDCVQIVDQDLR